MDWCGRGLWNVRGYVENAGRVCVERYIDRWRERERERGGVRVLELESV